MENLIIEYWTLYLNIIGIAFCSMTILVILVKILRDKKRNRQAEFGEEIYKHLIRKELERSFSRISEAINKERRRLWEYLENGNICEQKEVIHSGISRSGSSNHSKSTRRPIKNDESPPERYEEIFRMAAKGIGSKKISEMVNMPKGEVDLLISLKRDSMAN